MPSKIDIHLIETETEYRPKLQTVKKIARVLTLDKLEWQKLYLSSIGISIRPDVTTSQTIKEFKKNKEDLSPEEKILYAYFDIIRDRYSKSDEKVRSNIRQGLESLIRKMEKKK